LRAQRGRKNLRAQAYAEHRQIQFYGVLDEAHLVAQPRIAVGLINAHRPAHDDQAASALHARRHRLAVANAHVLPGERGAFERVSYGAEILDRVMLQNINLRHRMPLRRDRDKLLKHRAAADAAEMGIGALGRDSSARSPRQKSLLQQVRLVNFLDGVGFLADRGGKTLDADRSTVELVDYRTENRAVHLVEAGRVDFEQFERAQRDFARHDRRLVDLREVAHAPQQAVGDARRPARARSYFSGSAFVDRHLQQIGGAAHDLAQFSVIVKVEMKMVTESVAQ